jgi:hypothetical protein
MALTLEREVRTLRKEVEGMRSLLMEALDPDFGLELAEPIRTRIRRARKAGQFVALEQVVRELRK